MRKFIMFLCLISFVFIAAKKIKEEIFTLKDFEKSFSKIDEKFYMSKYEATNLQYRTFIEDLKRNGEKEKLLIAQVDSEKWKEFSKFDEPYVQFYFRHSAYNNYPVVNISYEGAVLFCEWLTKNYNLYEKRKFKKVKFRLPTQQEWEKAARGNFKESLYPWGGWYLRDYKGCVQCNYAEIGDENITLDSTGKPILDIKKFVTHLSPDIPISVDSYKPNDFGMYNISGNAAEMVFEKGITRGGSFISPGGDVMVISAEKYTHPDVYIGFRICMEVIEMY